MAFGKPIKDNCSSCGKESWIAHKAKRLCKTCNDSAKRRAKKKEDEPSMVDLFWEIWNERPRVSFISGKKLDKYEDTDLWYSLFAHVLAKGKAKFPDAKFDKENIVLLTPREHLLLDQGTEEERIKYALETNCDWGRIKRKKIELLGVYK